MSFNKTHFGYQEIPAQEKNQRVAEVFSSVANRYDLMNDLMSFGLHRLWKRFTIAQSQARSGQIILDIAGGTGDLTRAFAKCVGEKGRVILADINTAMLQQGRERLLDKGFVKNIGFIQANAECLPFLDNTFDCISIAFGLRNVTHPAIALQAMYRILKSGGRLLVLEFSKPVLPLLDKLYDAYSFNIIPKLGEWICKDAASYQYLVESIRMHPNQEQLKKIMVDSGFDEVNYHNLSGGIVALHIGYKY